MNPGDRIYVAGHHGMVGSALTRRLKQDGFDNLLLRTRAELDLTDQHAVEQFFAAHKPDYVFLAAARVGGIGANAEFPADFIRDNLQIQTNVIHSAHVHGAKKLLFLGSSCVYPKHAPQPIPETALLTGLLEPTNEPYAIAKIAGLRMCDAYRAQFGGHYISVMPTNLYGPNDNYDLQSAHVLAALIRRFHEAKQSNAPSVTLWGTGTPLREFLHVDDLADACLFLMHGFDDVDLVNVGWGRDISIRELAALIADVVGYAGKTEFDASKPDGTPRKLLDTSRLGGMGWKPRISLRQGIALAYASFQAENTSRTIDATSKPAQTYGL